MNCEHRFTDKEFDGHRWCVSCDIAFDEENVTDYVQYFNLIGGNQSF